MQIGIAGVGTGGAGFAGEVVVLGLMVAVSACVPPPLAEDLRWEWDVGSPHLIDVSWSQAANGDALVEFEVDGDWIAAPSFQGQPGRNTHLLAGVPAGSTVPWRVSIDRTVAYGPDPIRTPRGDPGVVVTATEGAGPGFVLTSYIHGYGDGRMLIYDRSGRLVWQRPHTDGTSVQEVRASKQDGLLLALTTADDPKKGWPVKTRVETWTLRGLVQSSEVQPYARTFVESAPGTFAVIADDHFGDKLYEAGESTPLWECPGRGGCYLHLSYFPDDDLYLLAEVDGALYAVEPGTGTTVWSIGVDGGVPSPFERIYDIQVAPDGTVWALASPDDGTYDTLLWHLRVDGGELAVLSMQHPAADHSERVDPAAGGVFVGSSARTTEFDSDLTERWSMTVNGGGKARLGRTVAIEDLYSLL